MFIFKSKNKSNNIIRNKFISRKELLACIVKGSVWSRPQDKSQYSTIKENLKLLKNNLCLNELDCEILYLERNNYKYDRLSGWLTARQMHCMAAINFSIQENNVQGAYHELYDFIESYRMLNDKPIDMVERIIIRNAIIQIESILT